MKTILDMLRTRYPKVFEDVLEVRTMKDLRGGIGNVTEIYYKNNKVRTIRWADDKELHVALKGIERSNNA